MTRKEIPFGDGDPAIGARLQALHDEAVSRGLPMYQDPETGLWVQTATQLRSRGTCCGRGCRHCPYPRALQASAGRLQLRPPEE